MTNQKPRFDMKRFAEALTYSAHLHARQTRKSSDLPYISHLLGVASLTMEYGGGEDECIAALLHDAAEDQGGMPTLEHIRAKFRDGVADIVNGCTDAYAELLSMAGRYSGGPGNTAVRADEILRAEVT